MKEYNKVNDEHTLEGEYLARVASHQSQCETQEVEVELSNQRKL